eukprot:NODE_1829_length_2363_cov_13.046512.p1 GENE.NODE_1829_length_2363_cov_13.046512~~NODE_1829_length_2363_cov_13.046512.p1  ORF type:complete len:669 (+),score=203.83 NODE_1829_length_2363_cov_13.046512:99-2105(+)
MTPISDGKYSVDAYMQCIEICFENLKKKMNRSVVPDLDYCVFHTGGGYHIIKKAFERLLKSHDSTITFDQRQEMHDRMLMPSVHVTKIVGPCHTVSSFLNISSVVMNAWSAALGKILLVFTFEAWRIKFYRHALLQPPSSLLHEYYCNTWQRFDFMPHGRRDCGVDVWALEKDVYYLMEIDPWGRRWYHRGGIMTEPIAADMKLLVDDLESRKMREHYGPVPESEPKEKPKLIMEKWKDIEYQLMIEQDFPDGQEKETVQEAHDRSNVDSKINVYDIKAVPRPPAAGDGLVHTYQIVGSWTAYKEAEEMRRERGEQTFTFIVTLGENSWEEFFLLQDNDWSKRIYPADRRSWKATPCIGPHSPTKTCRWMIDGRDLEATPEEDLGLPGDRYLVTFTWKGMKDLVWDRIEGKGDYVRNDVYIRGSWNIWTAVPMKSEGNGVYSVEVQQTSLKAVFSLARDDDDSQLLWPEVATDEWGDALSPGSSGMPTSGPDLWKPRVKLDTPAPMWEIKSPLGEAFRIELLWDTLEPDDTCVTWTSLGMRPLVEPAKRYYLSCEQNAWGTGERMELLRVRDTSQYKVRLTMKSAQEDIQVLENNNVTRCIHPERVNMTQQQVHSVLGPDAEVEKDGARLCWSIGRAASDRARLRDVFVITYDKDAHKVSWTKHESME